MGIKNKGFILLDSLVTMIIIIFCLTIALSGLGLAYKNVSNQNERVIKLLQEKNSYEKDFITDYEKK